ncbi:hypothetical protein FRC04_000352 [Tulasnella sp. 424]|nr:hypothetical protein FRC04_000352 [Tulasnella sp. 424]KAG8973310.1 hypothetical protein FRC05_008854 [Tulasnella sp. 425]
MAQQLSVTDFIQAQAANNSQWFNTEHNVNAAWNAIFHDHTIFPYNQGWLIIHPEAYPKQTDTNGLQNDLKVLKAAPRAQGGFEEVLLLCFEGKGSGAKWEAVQIQLQGFIQAAVGTTQGAVCWGIGAIGSKVQFWRYQRKDVNLDFRSLYGNGEYMVGIHIENNFIVDNNINVGRHLVDGYDLSADWASIVRILQMMATREPTPQGYGQIP